MKKLLAITAMVASAFGASLASAAPIVTWNYSITTAFTSAVLTDGTSLTTPTTLLEWGTPAPPNTQRSALEILDEDGTVSGSVSTYIGGGLPPAAFIADGNTLEHRNFPIFAPSLRSTTLTSTLTLVDPDNPPNPGGLSPLVIDVRFAETTNATPCGFPSTSVCDDIFVITSNPFLNASFDYLGVTYFVNVFPTDGSVLSFLDEDTCEAALGAGNTTCFGFQTAENQATDLPFGFTISTERLDVPEPGSLALVGLALLGAGYARRRRLQA